MPTEPGQSSEKGKVPNSLANLKKVITETDVNDICSLNSTSTESVSPARSDSKTYESVSSDSSISSSSSLKEEDDERKGMTKIGNRYVDQRELAQICKQPYAHVRKESLQ